MKITEIFYSIQGEGPSAGLPCVFLRLAICNLRCSWCDTKYSWDWEHYDYSKEVEEANVTDVLSRTRRYNSKHLVITGGEPMLQQKELGELVAKLPDYWIEVETNGTILPIDEFARHVSQWNVSPKLANSDNPVEAREVSECYAYFRDRPNAFFKFVVEGDDDLFEVASIVHKYDLPRERVILMPEAKSETMLKERSTWLIERCKAEGYRFSTRLQIALYGNRKGV